MQLSKEIRASSEHIAPDNTRRSELSLFGGKKPQSLHATTWSCLDGNWLGFVEISFLELHPRTAHILLSKTERIFCGAPKWHSSSSLLISPIYSIPPNKLLLTGSIELLNFSVTCCNKISLPLWSTCKLSFSSPQGLFFIVFMGAGNHCWSPVLCTMSLLSKIFVLIPNHSSQHFSHHQ